MKTLIYEILDDRELIVFEDNSKNPDAIKRSTETLGADYYVGIDTKNKNIELKGKTKGGVMDWKIKDNISPEDIVNRGKVKKC